jgi:hypothetical protein
MEEKIIIRKDEWYPVYTFSVSTEGLDVSNKELKQMMKIFEDFKKLQEKLFKMYEEDLIIEFESIVRELKK